VRDGVLDGGPRLAERGVEANLIRIKSAARSLLERCDIDPIDPDVTEIGDRWIARDDLGQAGRGERVGVVAGTMNGERSDRDQRAVQCRGDLQLIPGKPTLPE
jgi:hypothetical protein